MAQYTGIELIELTDDELQAVAGGAFNNYSFNNASNSFNGGNTSISNSFNGNYSNNNSIIGSFNGNVVVGNDF